MVLFPRDRLTDAELGEGLGVEGLIEHLRNDELGNTGADSGDGCPQAAVMRESFDLREKNFMRLGQ